MTPTELVEDLRMKARAALMSRPDQRYGIVTSLALRSNQKQPTALIGIATKKQSLVIAMSMDDYNGNGDIADSLPMAVLDLLGCEAPTAIERAEAEVAEAAKPRLPGQKK